MYLTVVWKYVNNGAAKLIFFFTALYLLSQHWQTVISETDRQLMYLNGLDG